MKTTIKANQHGRVVVIQGAQANAVIRSLELSQGQKPLTVQGAIDQWVSYLRKNSKSSQTSAQCISYVNAWARDQELTTTALNSIEEEDVNAWINSDDAGQLGTRKVKLAILRGFFRFCTIRELLTKPNPSTLAAVDYGALSHKQKEVEEIKPFKPADFNTLIASLDEQLKEIQPKIELAKSSATTKRLLKRRDLLLFWKSAAVIGRCAGLRLGDICQLEWDCFGRVFTVWTDKRNKRVQPHIWNKELFEDTVAQIPTDSAQYCFPAKRHTMMHPKRRGYLSIEFRRLCEALKLKSNRFHSLRHAYATECHKAGIATPHISENLGHSSSKTTQKYIH